MNERFQAFSLNQERCLKTSNPQADFQRTQTEQERSTKQSKFLRVLSHW